MRERVKKICQNPNHPFKQKWYWHIEMPEDSEFAYLYNDKYCSSCASFLNTLKTVIRVMGLEPKPTLYGEKFIVSDKEQIKQLVDEL